MTTTMPSGHDHSLQYQGRIFWEAFFISFAAVLLFLPPVPALAASGHCSADEQTIFTCSVRGSSKVISVCASRKLTKDKGYIQYRFGAPGKIELEYPPSREGTQEKFTYSHYFRAQVDRTEVGFKNGRYEYSVFSDYEGDIRPVINESGVVVSDSEAKEEKRLLCKGKPVNRLGALSSVVPCGGEEGECQQLSPQSRLRIHLFPLAQSQPALDDPVDHPDNIETEEDKTDADQRGEGAECAPEEAEPEGPDLPAEVRGKPRALYFLLFDIVDDDRRDARDAEQKGACLEGVDDHRNRLRLLERVGRG